MLPLLSGHDRAWPSEGVSLDSRLRGNDRTRCSLPQENAKTWVSRGLDQSSPYTIPSNREPRLA